MPRYTTAENMYTRFGRSQVLSWARKASGEKTINDARIEMAILDAEAMVEQRLGVVYATPFKAWPNAPRLVTLLVEQKAAVLLQSSMRGIDDETDTTLSMLQDDYDNLMADIVQLRVVLSDESIVTYTPQGGIQ